MELELSRLLYITIIFALIIDMPINVHARDNNKRSKEKTGGFQNNICDITDRKSKVHCYCENTREPHNATKAECWVFNGGIPHDDPIWQSFTSQPTLVTLSFNVRVDGALPYIPSKAFQYLKKLRTINIKYGNILEVTPFALANLTTIKEAILSQNQIERIHPHAFAHLPNVTIINLEENMILEIGTEVFYDVPKLQKLVLTKNNISSIVNGAFQHTFNLQELDLNRNNIFNLNRHTFDGLANLRKLDLKRNYIYNLTEFTFAELWNLQELLLGKNNLKFVSERAFDGLSQLKKLALDENKLLSFPPRLFEGVRGLSILDLRLNQLQRFTYDNVKPIIDNLRASNSSLLLEDNDLICDCHLKWVLLFWNETTSPSTKSCLADLTCKLDTSKLTSFEVKSASETEDVGKSVVYNKEDYLQKVVKSNVLKLHPEILTCPIEEFKTTVSSIPISNPVIVLENEIRSFYRLDSANDSSEKRLCTISFVYITFISCIFLR